MDSYASVGKKTVLAAPSKCPRQSLGHLKLRRSRLLAAPPWNSVWVFQSCIVCLSGVVATSGPISQRDLESISCASGLWSGSPVWIIASCMGPKRGACLPNSSLMPQNILARNDLHFLSQRSLGCTARTFSYDASLSDFTRMHVRAARGVLHAHRAFGAACAISKSWLGSDQKDRMLHTGAINLGAQYRIWSYGSCADGRGRCFLLVRRTDLRRLFCKSIAVLVD